MRLRAPEPEDAPAVFDVLAVRDITDLGAPDVTLADVHNAWHAPDFQLAEDAVVVEADGGLIVGYAAVMSPGTEAVVAPEHEGRGIGTLLLRWAEQRDRERGRARHRQWVAAANERGRELLLCAGYEPERSYLRMVRGLGDVPAPQAPPPEISLRPVDPGADAMTLHVLSELSFSVNSDYRAESLDQFVAEHLQAHDLDPGLSCVAHQGATVVGFLLARQWTETMVGYVDLLAVRPDRAHRGLGTAILQSAFARFAAAGLGEAQLGVASDNTRALALYERCGMAARFRFDTYHRPVTPTGAPPSFRHLSTRR